MADFGKGGARVEMVDVGQREMEVTAADLGGQWNATGTTLTTSDDDGVIRIYKRELSFGCCFFCSLDARGSAGGVEADSCF